MKQAETEQASSASGKFNELWSRNTSEHNMGPAGYTVKLDQCEEEDKQLAEDQERPSGRWMTAPQWWVIDNGCWTDSWLSAQV
jgi:hypothetical protein